MDFECREHRLVSYLFIEWINQLGLLVVVRQLLCLVHRSQILFLFLLSLVFDGDALFAKVNWSDLSHWVLCLWYDLSILFSFALYGISAFLFQDFISLLRADTDLKLGYSWCVLTSLAVMPCLEVADLLLSMHVSEFKSTRCVTVGFLLQVLQTATKWAVFEDFIGSCDPFNLCEVGSSMVDNNLIWFDDLILFSRTLITLWVFIKVSWDWEFMIEDLKLGVYSQPPLAFLYTPASLHIS